MEDIVLDNNNDSLYEELSQYMNDHKRITFGEYESAVLKDLCLFNMPNDEYIANVEATLDAIIHALPSFKRIFARPIIRLKDEHHIVPVESVKVIDKRSLTHIASRCELWENITEDGIKPRKLMTLEHIETYSIYENVAFACAVDSVFNYINRTLIRIKDIVYGCRDIHFNMLDRTHHRLYFLAIGKLYLEYVSSTASKERCSRCIDKMLFIDRTLRLKLNSPVYRHCKKRTYSIKLKKTNIFRSHKDYAEIYKILKMFDVSEEDSAGVKREISVECPEYKAFCKMVTVFAVSHFNYEIPTEYTLDADNFALDCSFMDWQLSARWIEHKVADTLVFTTKKNKEFRSCVVFGNESSLTPARMNELKRDVAADEYLICSPNVYGSTELLYLSIFDIDSFRRIQQILLRGMICADTERKVCAFCGKPLIESEHGHRCNSCMSEISTHVCPETNKSYFVSEVLTSEGSTLGEKKTQIERRRFLHDRLSEAQLHFRNITPITPHAKPICPHCRKAHDI